MGKQINITKQIGQRLLQSAIAVLAEVKQEVNFDFPNVTEQAKILKIISLMEDKIEPKQGLEKESYMFVVSNLKEVYNERYPVEEIVKSECKIVQFRPAV